MHKTTTKEYGFSVLYLAILIASISAVFSFTVSQSGLQFIQLNRLNEGRLEMDHLLTTCSERVLMEVRNDESSNLSGTLNEEYGDCDYTVTGSVPNKVVSIEASSGTNFADREFTITETSPVIIIE